MSHDDDRDKPPTRAELRNGPPKFSGITRGDILHWTLIIPLLMVVITTIGMVFHEQRDALIDKVLGDEDTTVHTSTH